MRSNAIDSFQAVSDGAEQVREGRLEEHLQHSRHPHPESRRRRPERAAAPPAIPSASPNSQHSPALRCGSESGLHAAYQRPLARGLPCFVPVLILGPTQLPPQPLLGVKEGMCLWSF
ncbi:hypothetical protein SASPL_152863 [Salvia splendens]|uniref:Uncharacterized protein n=1 Tax=Salvia splendens TaxID=180675 RepID=A0A8X8Z0S2_SALSN|nr:hypothetical protein SASPL_152863 [Salvia splendens]